MSTRKTELSAFLVEHFTLQQIQELISTIIFSAKNFGEFARMLGVSMAKGVDVDAIAAELAALSEESDVGIYDAMMQVNPAVTVPVHLCFLTDSLITRTYLFLQRAGRKPSFRQGRVLEVGYPVVFLQDDDPIPATLREATGRVGLVYSGVLSEYVHEVLHGVREREGAVLLLHADTIEAALTDQTAQMTLFELERRYFQKQNLFIQYTSLRDPALFFGRSRALEQASRSLAAGTSVLVSGARKVGKTSLLHQLRLKRPRQPWCWIDLQKYNPVTQADWPLQALTEIRTTLEQWVQAQLPDKKPPWRVTEDVSSVSVLERQIRRRLEWIQGNGETCDQMVLVLDELERIIPRDGDPPGMIERYVFFTGALRSLVQSSAQWLVVLAADLRPTAQQLNLLPDGRTNPLFRFFHEQPLGMLSAAEVDELLVGLGRLMGLEWFDQRFPQVLNELVGGHPMLARLVVGRAIEHMTGKGLSTEAVDTALDEMSERYELGSIVEQNFWLPMTEAERVVARHALYAGEAPQRPPASVSLRASTWRKARASLTRQGLLAEGKLTMGVLRDWIADEFPEAAK